MVFHHRHSINLCEADDASVTSTISVDSTTANKKTAPLHTTVTLVTATKKSVRFDLDANEEHDHPLYYDECADGWYRTSAYRNFKHSTMCDARALAQTETLNRSPFSYQRVMERAYQTCKDVINEETESFSTLATPQERRNLTRWAEVAPQHPGLDKWALHKIGKEKRRRRFELVDFVLTMQDVLAEHCTEDEHAEYIRKNCERISRPSRMFAQALAQALAQANAAECNVRVFFQ